VLRHACTALSSCCSHFLLHYSRPLLQTFYGIEMPFILVAKDTSGHKRTSGGDTFEVTVENEAGALVGSSRVVDRGTGLYECFYR